eukprot:6614462-Pyramimonas_sp.AAC.1
MGGCGNWPGPLCVALEHPHVMEAAGVGRCSCGARATTCYGRGPERWPGPLWRSSSRLGHRG